MLIVGAHSEQVATAIRIAVRRGAMLRQVATPESAIEELCAGRGADLLLAEASLDIDWPIRALGRERIVIPVVAYGNATDDHAGVVAISAGATEFLRWPADPELIAAILVNVGDERRELAFDDRAMRDLLAMARQIAPSDASLLITGESGAGKEVVARYAHRHSGRAERPFVSANCAAIPENLLESEFGHEKGHFTGATARRIGKFEEPSGGTLLLTRSARWPPSARPSCCAPSRRAGSTGSAAPRPVKIDLRLIATSNRDLGAEAAAGRFREELLFRLNVINLHLPALRERPPDIALRRQVRQSQRYASASAERGDPGPVARARMAGQRPRAGKLHPSRRVAGRGRRNRASGDHVAGRGSRRPQLWPPRCRDQARTGGPDGRRRPSAI